MAINDTPEESYESSFAGEMVECKVDNKRKFMKNLGQDGRGRWTRGGWPGPLRGCRTIPTSPTSVLFPESLDDSSHILSSSTTLTKLCTRKSALQLL